MKVGLRGSAYAQESAHGRLACLILVGVVVAGLSNRLALVKERRRANCLEGNLKNGSQRIM